MGGKEVFSPREEEKEEESFIEGGVVRKKERRGSHWGRKGRYPMPLGGEGREEKERVALLLSSRRPRKGKGKGSL